MVAAFRGYLDTIPDSKRFDRELFYELRDVVGKSGFGIGSAGLPAYNILVEGYSQALDNDVVLSMKQANVPAVSRFVDTADVDAYFEHEGHRTVVSQRALQVHTDPLLGHTDIDGTGYVVSEVSPYEVDLNWTDINEPEDIRAVVDLLGRATAKIHCASDEDSDQDLVEHPGRGGHRGLAEGPTPRVRRLAVPVGHGLRDARPGGPHALRRRLPRGPDGDGLDLRPPPERWSQASMWDMSPYRVADHRVARHGRVEGGQVVGGEVHVGGADVLLEVGDPLGAGDRDDVVALREHPGERELAGRAALVLGDACGSCRPARGWRRAPRR